MLGLLIHYENEDGCAFEFLDRMFPLDTREEVDHALTEAIEAGFIVSSGFAYYPTEMGREEYSDAMSRPISGESIKSWRDEVLSGIIQTGKDAGKRSPIDSAVLPGKETRSEPKTIECIDELDKLRKLARRLEIGLDELKEGMRIEQIKRCLRCGDIAIHFRRGDNPTCYRSHCPECTRQQDRNYYQRKAAEKRRANR